MNTKKEVYLIKGKYYSFSYDYICVPLTSYGAIEGSISVDADCYIFPFEEICADVSLFRHGDKWGLFPKIDVLGMGCAEWASEDNTPFVYQDFRLVLNDGIKSEYILLRKRDKWGAVVAKKGEDMAPVWIEELEPFSNVSPEEVFSKLKLGEKYSICTDIEIEDSDPEETEFDPEKDFMKQYDLDGSTIRILGLVLGEEKYTLSMNFIKAAAHHNPYALFLIGKVLYTSGENRINGLKLTMFKRDTPDPQEVSESYEDFVLAEEYMKLSRQYAAENGDTTLEDIVKYYLKYRINYNKKITSPDKPTVCSRRFDSR